MAVRVLWRICQRNLSCSSARNFFFKGTRTKIDDQRKELVDTLSKETKDVFAIAERSREGQVEKGREAIEDAIFIYLQRQGKTRRGHVEFIQSALSKLKDYDLHRDLTTYKTLFKIFPEGKMIPKSFWQSDFMHFPKQQDCGMSLLIQMEEYGVIPDDEFGRLILSRFGMESMVMTRYQRMMYWMPKKKNLNPWPVPELLPKDERTLSTLALHRMKMDPLTEVTVHETKLIHGVSVDTYVASSQSPDQRELLAKHDKSKPIYVEGPFRSWFRERQMEHFILRADPDLEYWEKWKKHKQYLEDTKYKPETYKWFNFIERKEVDEFRPPSVHEQEDGNIFAVAFFGENSMSALRAWLRILTLDNPSLHDASIVFNVDLPSTEKESVESGETEVRSLPS